MGVKVGITDRAYFGGIFGTSTLQTSRTAIVKQSNSRGSRIPALWLLDPYGCTALSVSGGAQLTLGDTTTSPRSRRRHDRLRRDGLQLEPAHDLVQRLGHLRQRGPPHGTTPG